VASPNFGAGTAVLVDEILVAPKGFYARPPTPARNPWR